MGRVAKLIMVTEVNNNKFYDMVEDDDGSITATWGRVDVTSTVTHYPVGKKKWETLLKSKLKKGYVDMTELRAEQVDVVDFTDISNKRISKIVRDLQNFANKSVQQNYTISTEAVTVKQLDTAQDILDDLSKYLKPRTKAVEVNDRLLELYRTIPRRMKKVQHHLFDDDSVTAHNLGELNMLVANEQATLDVLRGQVKVSSVKTENAGQKNILDAMGLEFQEVADKDIQFIKKLMGKSSGQFRGAFRVINQKSQSKFDRNLADTKSTNIRSYWHGSRNENWWSILDTGLVLRPTNAVITGKMFGYGLYGAPKARKSIGYTSLRGSYWASGSSSRGFLALFDFHVGNSLKVKRHEGWMSSLTYQKLRAKGDYDSLYVVGGVDLINDEVIVYRENQLTIKYLVEITN